MRLLTWNINSVRLRLPLLLRLVEKERPDIVCLQETKTPDEFFPLEPLQQRGYVHHAIRGMKGYNGVAILSLHPLNSILHHDWANKTDCRHISATLQDGTEIHCVYVPAGGDIPDAATNEKFAHKLQFMAELSSWWEGQANHARTQRIVMVGDLNIAPLPEDVWSHRQMLGVVSHTPVEVAAMERLRKSLDWVDVVRRHHPPPQKLFSWWSYRAHDWAASDRGRRLDHIWTSPSLASSVRAADILKPVRGWDQPSDHVPVTVDFD